MVAKNVKAGQMTLWARFSETKREHWTKPKPNFGLKRNFMGAGKNWVKSRQVQKLWIENWIAKCRRKKKYLERSGSSSETQKQASVLFWKLMPNPIYKWCCCCCCEQIYFFLLFLAGFQSFAESQSIGENDKVFWTKSRLGQGQLSSRNLVQARNSIPLLDPDYST